MTKKKLTLPLQDAKLQTANEKTIAAWSDKYEIGFETLSDVIKELQRPGLDPRENMDPPSFKSDILETKDLQIGMVLDGTVRNVTDFGAFVDIGLHNDGLVHKSQLADRFVANPSDVVSVGMQVKVRVLEVDLEREKVSLSMKTLNENNSNSRPSQPREARPPREKRNDESTSSIKGNISWG